MKSFFVALCRNIQSERRAIGLGYWLDLGARQLSTMMDALSEESRLNGHGTPCLRNQRENKSNVCYPSQIF